MLGTIAFFILLGIRARVNANIIVVMAVFPIALIAAGYSIWRGEHRFFVLTTERLLSKPGWGDVQIIEFEALVSVSIRYNWLMLLEELEIVHDLPMEMAPRRSALRRVDKRTKTDYVDSIPSLRMYCSFLQQQIKPHEEEVESSSDGE